MLAALWPMPLLLLSTPLGVCYFFRCFCFLRTQICCNGHCICLADQWQLLRTLRTPHCEAVAVMACMDTLARAVVVVAVAATS